MRLRSYFLLTLTNAFNPDSLPTKTKIGLNNFLLDQYDLNIIHTEVKDPYNFNWQSVSALQEFLAAKGQLAPSYYFNSLIIGTLQNYLYDKHIYPDRKPCGIFGHNTRQSLQLYLQRQPLYRTLPAEFRINANSVFDSRSVRLLQKYLQETKDKQGHRYYNRQIDGRFSSTTVKALGKYLHDREARVAFTRDHNKKYNFVKGVWGYKTSITLMQYLVDHGYYLANVNGRFNSKAVYQLGRFLADYERERL